MPQHQAILSHWASALIEGEVTEAGLAVHPMHAVMGLPAEARAALALFIAPDAVQPIRAEAEPEPEPEALSIMKPREPKLEEREPEPSMKVEMIEEEGLAEARARLKQLAEQFPTAVLDKDLDFALSSPSVDDVYDEQARLMSRATQQVGRPSLTESLAKG